MKILTIAPTPFFANRGTHIRILEEARAQVRRGHDVTIATYHVGGKIPRKLSENIDVRRIRRWLFWYKKLEAGPDWQKILLNLLLIKKVFFLARTEKPDVIHAHLHEGAAIAWVVTHLLLWRQIPVIVDFHGSLVNEMKSHGYLKFQFAQNIFGKLEQWIDNMGDCAVVSSWENQKIIQKARTDEVLVLPDGVDLSQYTLAQKISQKELRKKFHIPSDKTIIIYTGALLPNKGMRYLLEAIPFVCKEVSQAHFVLAGFPIDDVAQFIADNNLKERVTIISPLSYFKLPQLLMSADIAVDPKDSAVAQASGKILQYMGAGLPIVCFDKQNNREYLENDAFYAQEISAFGLTRSILRAIKEKDLRKKYGQQAQQSAQKFSWDVGAQIFEDVCGKIAKQ